MVGGAFHSQAITELSEFEQSVWSGLSLEVVRKIRLGPVRKSQMSDWARLSPSKKSKPEVGSAGR